MVIRLSLLSLGLVFCIGGGAYGDDEKAQPLTEVRKASEIMSHQITNSANEKLGKIEDLAIDKDGHCHFLIVGMGGVVNSDKFIPVPCSAVKPDHANKQCVLEMSKTSFESAPSYTREQYYSAWPKEWRQKVCEHFNVKCEKMIDTEKAIKSAEGTSTHKSKMMENEGQLFYATKIIGANVRNRNNDKLATIDDLAMNGKGCVKFAVIGHGGVLKIGESKIGVPWKALDLTMGEKGAVMASIDMSGKQLEGAPVLKQDNFADLMSETYVQSSYRYFNVNDRTEVEAKTPKDPNKNDRP